MAKLIWVFALEIPTNVYDVNGAPVQKPQKGMIYTAYDNRTDIADDGSQPLYHSADPIDPIKLSEIYTNYNPVKPPTGLADPTVTNITATGAKVVWTAPSGGSAVDNYIVNVVDGATSTPISGSPFTMAGTTLSKTLSGLSASTGYKVVVTAKNSVGEVSSAPVTFTTTA